jgi:glycosyltransferase involved in cell wall biosynthesis
MASFATTYGLMAAMTGFRPLIVQTWSRDISIVPWRGWKRFYYRPIVEYVLRRSDAVTTDGPAHARLVCERFPSVAQRTHATVWGIRLADYEVESVSSDKARRVFDLPPDVPVVTSARGIRSWYNPETVLPALSLLLQRDPSVHVVVLTLEHEHSDETATLLQKLKEHDRCRLIDRFLDVQDMRSLWAASDIMVSVPTFDGISEGLLEGMLGGVIPVVSDISSNRHLFSGTPAAVFVKGDGFQDLARTLETVIDQLPAIRSRLVANNREWVRKHGSVEATAQKVAELVASVAS